MNYVCKKERKYLYKNLKIIAIVALMSVLVALLEDKHIPFLIMGGLFCSFLLLLEIKKYNYSTSVTVDSYTIKEGKTSIFWDNVNSVLFTTNKNGPYIEIWCSNKKYILIAEEYEHPWELRKLIEDICQQKGIIHKVEDRASYQHNNDSITDQTAKPKISRWNIILGIVVSMGLPLVVIMLLLTLVFLFLK